MSDFNAKVIDQFRANKGYVQNFGNSLVLLHNVGAKSGRERVSPVMAIAEPDNSWLIAASAAGSKKNPAWYANLLATPHVSIETGGETVAVTASDLEGDDYKAAWAKFVARSSGFAAYQERAGDRRIPVIRLTRRDG